MRKKGTKFLFDTDFDLPAEQPRIEVSVPEIEEAEDLAAEPPPPTYSEEELNQTREESFAAGREAGLAEATESRDAAEAQALFIIAQTVGALLAEQSRANEARGQGAIQVAMALVHKLMPEAARRGALVEIEALVLESLSRLGNEPRVVVRVPEPLVEPIRARIDAIVAASGFEGKVVVNAGPGLAPADCKVEWADGGAERDQARLMDEMDALVARYIAGELASETGTEAEDQAVPATPNAAEAEATAET
jgi:flagellar assembly protein FliH